MDKPGMDPPPYMEKTQNALNAAALGQSSMHDPQPTIYPPISLQNPMMTSSSSSNIVHPSSVAVPMPPGPTTLYLIDDMSQVPKDGVVVPNVVYAKMPKQGCCANPCTKVAIVCIVALICGTIITIVAVSVNS